MTIYSHALFYACYVRRLNKSLNLSVNNLPKCISELEISENMFVYILEDVWNYLPQEYEYTYYFWNPIKEPDKKF